MSLEESHQPNLLIPAEEWGPGYRLWRSLLTLLAQRGPDGTTPLVRVASHLMIILVALLVIGASRVQLPGWEIAEVTPEDSAADSGVTTIGSTQRRIASVGALVRAAAPITLLHERQSSEIRTYKVQPGDTLWAIADKFGVSAETVIWSNGMENSPDLLRLDQEIFVPPVNGVLHLVVEGDTVESVAKKYKADPAAIISLEANGLDPKNPTLKVGTRVMAPGGVKPMPTPKPVQQQYASSSAKAPANAPVGNSHFSWPSSGQITTRFRAYHGAIDIASYTGAPVRASDAGYVAQVIYSRVGYGFHIIIDHGNGFQTLYAHLSKINVRAGNTVEKGALIGLVGTTGNSTGPHLHFEIRQGGVQRNPFNYLP
jgi:murein DD-endopeptidase MepM/ murein hydrolase activator NlpD